MVLDLLAYVTQKNYAFNRYNYCFSVYVKKEAQSLEYSIVFSP